MSNVHELLEVVMDIGRRPEARFPDRDVILSEKETSDVDLAYSGDRVGKFGDDNRAGIERAEDVQRVHEEPLLKYVELEVMP